MSKIKPQIKKNNPSKSNYSTGWNIFGVVQKFNFIRQVACV